MGGKDPLLQASVAAVEATADQAPIELIEVAGRIKWFDVSKGYGFIVPDDGSGDVLLHVTVLRRDGYQTACEGARVVCEAQRRMTKIEIGAAKRQATSRIFTSDI